MIGMIRFLMIGWVSIGNLLILFSIFLITSMTVFSKLVVGKEKFSPSCKRHWESFGIVAEDRFRNQSFFMVSSEEPGIYVEKDDGLISTLKEWCWGREEVEGKVYFIGFNLSLLSLFILCFSCLQVNQSIFKKI